MEFIFDFIYNPKLETLKKIVRSIRKDNKHINDFKFINYKLVHIRQPYDCMKYLIMNGCNPNSEEEFYHLKPIHFQYDYDVIKLLIDNGVQPNPKDINDFNPLFFQKSPQALQLLLQTNEIYTSKIIQVKKNIIGGRYNPYIKMLVSGGYDPYSEINISVSPIFLQRNNESFNILINHYKNNYLIEELYDISFENILFKYYINDMIIKSFLQFNYGDIYNVNHQNILGNTPLHVQYRPEIIVSLLQNGANTKIKNNDNLTALQYQVVKNNLLNANIILKFSSAKTIQNCWRRFWFHKTFIKPKYYKIKKKFLDDFVLLSPSECHTFPGGIEYQNAFNTFMLHL